MGLEIVLQAEIGTQADGVADTRNFLEKLLPQIDDEEYPILGGIDPCGDTIFNGIQMRPFPVGVGGSLGKSNHGRGARAYFKNRAVGPSLP